MKLYPRPNPLQMPVQARNQNKGVDTERNKLGIPNPVWEVVTKKDRTFGYDFRSQFFQAMSRGEYHTNDMLSSKWRDMNQKVRRFNGIYSQKWQTRRSSQSDAMIKLESEDQYREEFNAPFTLKLSWELMRKCPNWIRIPTKPTTTAGGCSEKPLLTACSRFAEHFGGAFETLEALDTHSGKKSGVSTDTECKLEENVAKKRNVSIRNRGMSGAESSRAAGKRRRGPVPRPRGEPGSPVQFQREERTIAYSDVERVPSIRPRRIREHTLLSFELRTVESQRLDRSYFLFMACDANCSLWRLLERLALDSLLL
ncbi:hypothetical protein R6Q59_035113 [Mikania micrantha]